MGHSERGRYLEARVVSELLLLLLLLPLLLLLLPLLLLLLSTWKPA